MINDEQKFERMLEELLDEMTGYPNALQKNGTDDKKDGLSHPQQVQNTLTSMQQSVENMRICVKYLLFDLDATRREILYLKKLLEDKGN